VRARERYVQMLGHNLENVLANVAIQINDDHRVMLAAMEDSEQRAKRIGQALIDLKPTLKEASVNLTAFCNSYLPFGKSAAYSFMNIASGKTTLARENARKNSAGAEKPTKSELPIIAGYMNFDRALATLQCMFWIEHGSDFASWAIPLMNEMSDKWLEQADLPLTKIDFGMVAMALAEMQGEDKLEFSNFDGGARAMVISAMEYAVRKTDLYYCGYPFVQNIAEADQSRMDLLKSGDVVAAKAMTHKIEVHAKVLGMTLEEVRMLHALISDHDDNFWGLRNGGRASQHPLWSAYEGLVGPVEAEKWCCEAMAMTAFGLFSSLGDHSIPEEIVTGIADRIPFDEISSNIARCFPKAT